MNDVFHGVNRPAGLCFLVPETLHRVRTRLHRDGRGLEQPQPVAPRVLGGLLRPPSPRGQVAAQDVQDAEVVLRDARDTHCAELLGLLQDLDQQERGVQAQEGVAGEPVQGLQPRWCRLPIDLAHARGLTAVAGGVEDEATRQQLAGAGCDTLQRYLFSRPLAPDAVLAWLAARGRQSSSGTTGRDAT